MAVTVKVYAVPIVNPVIVIGLDVSEFVILPGEEVTVYVWIGDPPLLVGASKVTVICLFPSWTDVIVGGYGILKGVTLEEGLEERLGPYEFVAVTVKVYTVPFVNPETIIGLDVSEFVILPGEEVTVYDWNCGVLG